MSPLIDGFWGPDYFQPTICGGLAPAFFSPPATKKGPKTAQLIRVCHTERYPALKETLVHVGEPELQNYAPLRTTPCYRCCRKLNDRSEDCVLQGRGPAKSQATYGEACCAETLPRPQAGDVWVMRTILHDWSDEESSQILSTLRAAMGATPVTLAIVEVCLHPRVRAYGSVLRVQI